MKIFDLTGRTALITGGGSGIGRGCAVILAKAGADVVIVGRRINKLEEVKAEIEAAGGHCACFPADLTKEENCKDMVEFCVNTFGRLDILINSAGSRGAHGDLETEFSTANYEKTIAADLTSTFMAVKYAYPECAKNGVGSIINIASLAALSARGPIVYSAAKGAVRSFSRTLAKRLGDQKIRVNTIYPGFIVTEMTAGVKEQPEIRERFEKESPLGLLGEVEDIGYCALYLASDAARFVTGQDFIVDGGATC
ncbi:MAG: SDR family oxidoreductase [Lachnospiraceae bacterium]|jgi:NAD(P)-dependent dehydrogenase (short-subunit alcohol dehydrogenase family)|nr:SDR family oxidoreductase [Lachnospiraceae bacterium]MCH4029921.1 SDR family oxidoreductase [Lachnospiraceae bacterium]MCH4070418.1 SDR family oxidoreductase [Lachnospiraceae bacterium]MCI1303014.1 SDR family oxidoreductase [Lachnospiraceae bacterium]MCI1332396.1 SDR family oxidoreductase [Lachnospiraceae bacterium]